MLEEIHELTGLCALAAVLATVGAGAAAYRYQSVKELLRLKRQTLVRSHGWGALGFAAFVALHYVTTDKALPLLYAGLLAFAAVLLLGWSFRLSRKLFQPIVKVKILLVVIATAALLLGHDQLEEKYPEKGDGDRESRYERVVPPSQADRTGCLAGVPVQTPELSSCGTPRRRYG